MNKFLCVYVCVSVYLCMYSYEGLEVHACHGALVAVRPYSLCRISFCVAIMYFRLSNLPAYSPVSTFHLALRAVVIHTYAPYLVLPGFEHRPSCLQHVYYGLNMPQISA